MSGASDELWLDASGETKDVGTVKFSRHFTVASEHEDLTVVTVREVKVWCARCRSYTTPLISEENWAACFLGASLGLWVAAIAGDFTNHPRREGVIYALAIAATILTVVLATIAYQRRKSSVSALENLAEEMDLARVAGAAKATRVPEASK